MQSAIRARPELESYVLVSGVGAAILLLIGGALGDLRRARPLIVGGLAALRRDRSRGSLITSGPGSSSRAWRVLGRSVHRGPGLARLVALAYTGVARATAIGLAYAVYGAARR